jgi:hypothetical protein
MNWDTLSGNWKQLKGAVQERWANLTDDDFDLALRDFRGGSVPVVRATPLWRPSERIGRRSSPPQTIEPRGAP